MGCLPDFPRKKAIFQEFADKHFPRFMVNYVQVCGQSLFRGFAVLESEKERIISLF
jgi:hypothetical protein